MPVVGLKIATTFAVAAADMTVPVAASGAGVEAVTAGTDIAVAVTEAGAGAGGEAIAADVVAAGAVDAAVTRFDAVSGHLGLAIDTGTETEAGDACD